MNWHQRIEVEQDVLGGKPVVKGTRIAVSFGVGPLAEGWSIEDLLDQYPALTKDDVRACPQYASEVLKSEQVYLLPASRNA